METESDFVLSGRRPQVTVGTNGKLGRRIPAKKEKRQQEETEEEESEERARVSR